MCSLVGVLLKKVYDIALKTFLSLLIQSCVFSFLLVVLFVNISTLSLFKDDRTSIVFQAETFLNCLVCLSSRADWSQSTLKSLSLNCLRFVAKKITAKTFCIQEKASLLDNLVVTVVVYSFKFEGNIDLKCAKVLYFQSSCV